MCWNWQQTLTSWRPQGWWWPFGDLPAMSWQAIAWRKAFSLAGSLGKLGVVVLHGTSPIAWHVQFAPLFSTFLPLGIQCCCASGTSFGAAFAHGSWQCNSPASSLRERRFIQPRSRQDSFIHFRRFQEERSETESLCKITSGLGADLVHIQAKNTTKLNETNVEDVKDAKDLIFCRILGLKISEAMHWASSRSCWSLPT